jgi:hypothetical protein
MVVLVLGTIGLDKNGEPDVTPVGAATLMVIAFVVGYRQRVFIQLVERVSDTILGPGNRESTTDATFELSPTELTFDPIATGASAVRR